MSRAEIQRVSNVFSSVVYPPVDSTADPYSTDEQTRMVASFLNPANQEAGTTLVGLVWLSNYGEGAVELARLTDGNVIISHFGESSDIHPYDSPEALSAIQARMTKLLGGTDSILPGNRK